MAGTPLILQPLVKYVDFQGRARRSEFWLFYLLIFVVFGCVQAWMLAPMLPVLSGGKPDMTALTGRIGPLLLTVLAGLLLYLPILAVKVRRLHDSNRTGWWVVLPYFASSVGQTLVYTLQGKEIMAATAEMQSQMQGAVEGGFDLAKMIALEMPILRITLPYTIGTSALAGLILFIFFVWPGTKGPNRFGNDPKASK